MSAQPKRLEKLHKESEGLARVDDYQSWPVNGHDVEAQIVKGGRLAGARGPKGKQMGVFFAINVIKRIDPARLAAAVPEPHAGVLGAALAAIDRDHVRDLGQ